MAPADLNPYASPAAAGNVQSNAPQIALTRLRIPSLGLMLLAGLWILAVLHGLFVALCFSGTRIITNVDLIHSVCVLPTCFIAYGAWCMRRGKRYRVALAAAIMASIPLLSPWIWMGIPFGIAALLILRRADVRAAFS